MLTLSLQERTNLPDPKLAIHFVGYQDDRCPADVVCISAGEARAFFWVVGEGVKPQVVTLPWSGSDQTNQSPVRVGKNQFMLQSLEPRPLQAGKVTPGEYKAVLQVRR